MLTTNSNDEQTPFCKLFASYSNLLKLQNLSMSNDEVPIPSFLWFQEPFSSQQNHNRSPSFIDQLFGGSRRNSNTRFVLRSSKRLHIASLFGKLTPIPVTPKIHPDRKESIDFSSLYAKKFLAQCKSFLITPLPRKTREEKIAGYRLQKQIAAQITEIESNGSMEEWEGDDEIMRDYCILSLRSNAQVRDRIVRYYSRFASMSLRWIAWNQNY